MSASRRAAVAQDGGTTSGWPPEGARYNCDERIVARMRLCVRESLRRVNQDGAEEAFGFAQDMLQGFFYVLLGV